MTTNATSPTARLTQPAVSRPDTGENRSRTVTIPTMAHPGPAATERVVSAMTRSRPHSVTLPAGTDLLESLVKVMTGLGVESAQVELLGGTVEHMSWSVPLTCPDDSEPLPT
ncbi:hypothetical protein JOF36_007844 [Pseudonocardia parietis]|uniref:CBS domain-containing protein n=1 Tax=Pseudonocardia parietis TaxID=570936 RepID=A0ABS4W7R8_9PSEU|nr:hypothetical protein [Pseudonocardia parietis]